MMESTVVDALVGRMQAVSINPARGACIPDAYVTEAVVDDAFLVLKKKLSTLVRGWSDDAMVEMTLESILTHLSAAFRTPYMEAVRAFQQEIVQLNNHHQRSISKHKEEVLEMARNHEEKSNTTRARCQEEVASLRVRFEGEVASLRQELVTERMRYEDEVASNKQESSIHRRKYDQDLASLRKDLEVEQRNYRDLQLEKHKMMLEAERRAGDSGIPANAAEASVTKTETWAAVVASGRYAKDQELPGVPHNFSIPESEVSGYMKGPYKKESEMYPFVFECLQHYLDAPRTGNSPGVKVWQTDSGTKSGFTNRKPDFTITIDGVPAPDPTSVIAPWEIKLTVPTQADFGQLYDYLKEVTKKQLRRRLFVGVIQSVPCTYVVTLERHRHHGWDYRVSRPMKLGEVLAHLCHSVIPSPDHRPPFPLFSFDLGIMQRRLGNPAFCAVAEFTVPHDFEKGEFEKNRWTGEEPTNGKWKGRDTMVVKRTLPAGQDQQERPVKCEIQILRRILSLGGHRNLPEIVFNSLDYQEFGILPCGAVVKPGDSRFEWRGILKDVLSALEWLHSNNIVHRDVRWDNIVYDIDHAVLIDLGAAIYIAEDSDDTGADLTRYPGVDTGLDNFSEGSGDTCTDRDRPADSIHFPHTPGAPSAIPSALIGGSRAYFYSGGCICCPRRLIGQLETPYIPHPADDCHAFVQLVNMLLWPRFWEGLRSDRVADASSDVAVKLERFWGEMERSSLWRRYVRAAEETNYKVLGEMGELCVYLGSKVYKDARVMEG